ncbi:hypothetical protein BMF94_3348 [Rhodotorula taiwanensis]|uniref:F-box domain-containing protein n=1 Tax=Rhodotorula taiwanensis TaxID=741276 RepID=A0A2S5BAL8_9BASI|nr:hypothetical protein BMF94_3348 [Rhodotorula taiwanensis]
MSTTSPSSRRRSDLNCLPSTVKSHIARLCADADRSLASTLELLRKTATTDILNALGDFDERRNGTAIGNLFCVSKEWSAIAAPFRFEKLNLKQFQSAIFAMRIVHLRGQHFKEISLVEASLPDHVQLVGLTPQLPNIATISTSDFRVAATSRRPYIEMDSDEAAYLENGIKNLFERVEHVSLHLKTVEALPNLLSATARGRLTRLSLHLEKPTGFSAFLETLVDLRSLDRLDLDFAGIFRTLDKQLTTLLAPDVSPAVLDFVSLFAPTLSHLALIFTSYRVHFVPQTPQGAVGLSGPFPHLEGLVLEGDAAALEGPLSSLTDENMPSSKKLVYLPDELPPATERRSGEPPIPTARRLIPLDHLVFHPIKPVPSTLDLKQLPVAQLPTKKLHRGQAAYRGVLSYSRGPAQPAASEFEVVKGKVQTTLKFLRSWRKRAKSQQDAASLVKMARALCDVELERIAHEA